MRFAMDKVPAIHLSVNVNVFQVGPVRIVRPTQIHWMNLMWNAKTWGTNTLRNAFVLPRPVLAKPTNWLGIECVTKLVLQTQEERAFYKPEEIFAVIPPIVKSCATAWWTSVATVTLPLHPVLSLIKLTTMASMARKNRRRRDPAGPSSTMHLDPPRTMENPMPWKKQAKPFMIKNMVVATKPGTFKRKVVLKIKVGCTSKRKKRTVLKRSQREGCPVVIHWSDIPLPFRM